MPIFLPRCDSEIDPPFGENSRTDRTIIREYETTEMPKRRTPIDLTSSSPISKLIQGRFDLLSQLFGGSIIKVSSLISMDDYELCRVFSCCLFSDRFSLWWRIAREHFLSGLRSREKTLARFGLRLHSQSLPRHRRRDSFSVCENRWSSLCCSSMSVLRSSTLVHARLYHSLVNLLDVQYHIRIPLATRVSLEEDSGCQRGAKEYVANAANPRDRLPRGLVERTARGRAVRC